MHAKELNDRSPLRLLENSIHGGLGRGNIGVVVARAGVGKTAFLVCVALDDLMRGKRVLHVAIDQPVDRVREFYEEIFMDLAHTKGLEDIPRERIEMERNRNIHTYVHTDFNCAKLREAVAFLTNHVHFTPQAVIIEGYPFERATVGDLLDLRQVARELDAEMWMSAVTHREAARNERGIPEPVAQVEQALSVVLAMRDNGSAVHLRLLKDHDNPSVSDLSLALDPTTMLLVKD